MSASQPTIRNQSLDALRGVAILLVLGRHFPYYALWHRIGWAGVDLFFVLSGFLVSGLLFNSFKESGELHIGRFVIRRGLKIWPGFYALLLFATILCVKTPTPMPWQKLFLSFTFLQNYSSTSLWSLGHIWSLAVEEHFYLFLPLLLTVLIRSRPVRPFYPIPAISGVCIVACLGLRYFTTHAGQYEFLAATHLRIDGLFAGVTLGYWFHFRREIFGRFNGTWSLFCGLLLCSPVFWYEVSSRVMQTIGSTILLVGFSLITAWVVSWTAKTYASRKGCAVLAKIGYYSYSIYLWHFMVGIIFEVIFPHSVIAFWFYVLLAIAVGIVMAKAIEFPFLRLRDRVVPRTPRSKNAVLAKSEIPLIPA